MPALASYSAGVTPRAISSSLRFKINYLSSTTIGGLVIIVIFGLLLIFLVDWRGLINSASLSANDPVVRGLVNGVTKTNSKVNGTRIYEFNFIYTVDGKTYSGTSYGSQYRDASDGSQILSGDSVQVQYSSVNPAFGVIVGKRLQGLPSFVPVLLGLFLLLGILAVRQGIKTGQKNVQLITHGILTTGKFIRKEESYRKTSQQGRRITEYLLAFEFVTKDGKRHETKVRTKDTTRLLDEREERLVYDETNPGSAVLIDSLPKGVRNFFDELG